MYFYYILKINIEKKLRLVIKNYDIIDVIIFRLFFGF